MQWPSAQFDLGGVSAKIKFTIGKQFSLLYFFNFSARLLLLTFSLFVRSHILIERGMKFDPLVAGSDLMVTVHLPQLSSR